LVSTSQILSIPDAATHATGVNNRDLAAPDKSAMQSIGETRSPSRRRVRIDRASGHRELGVPLVGIAAVCAIVAGWAHRGGMDLVAHEGLGYALGIAGLGMMTLLLLYSLRKRWKPLQRAGSAPLWLQVHMALGVLGPTAILFHANFRLGSLNSRAALFCMATVSLSGVIGRFLYTRIHSAFLDRRATLADLQEIELPVLVAAMRLAPELEVLLENFCSGALNVAAHSWLTRARAFVRIGAEARRVRRRGLAIYRHALVNKSLRDAPRASQVARCLREYAARVRILARMNVYERAFALWHNLHLPFCVVLFGASAIHVVAVHMY